MATNFPGPYELRFFYSTAVSGAATLTHVQRLNCDVSGTPAPGEDPGAVQITRRVASLDPAEDWMSFVAAEWANLLKPYASSNMNIIRCELWKYAPESFEGEFVTVHPLAVAGTNGVAIVPASQVIHTFRTLEGGVLKINVMEASIAAGQQSPLSAAGSFQGALRDFVLSEANWILGRDTSYPFAAMTYAPGTNEALFKKRYRQAS